MERSAALPNENVVQVRAANAADAAAIARLHIATWRAAYRAELPAEFLASLDETSRTDQWRSRLAIPTTQVLLAERDGDLVGFCAHGPGHDRDGHLTSDWEIYGLHIAPALRGRGIGSTLFSSALAVAQRAAAQRLTLWVVATNAAARRFYESKAMQPDGAEKRRELTRGVELHEVRYFVPLG